MKQVIQNYKTGNLRVDEVPAPCVKPRFVLVRNRFSAISVGTEMMKVNTARMNLLEKARSRPKEVKKVIESVKQQGLAATYRKVMNKLDSPSPLGYSAAGIVIEVGEGVDEFRVGDRVAIAGAGYANHAEINSVPKNLCAKIPEGVPLDQAAFATIGAIAMQGVRQASVQFGETVVVIGMGLIGLIASKILLATGHNVIGVDIDQFKVDFAKKCGVTNTVGSDKNAVVSLVSSMTNGFGADAVILTTATKSNEPIDLAAEVLRDKGKVVDVGNTKMDLPWNAYYEKELEFVFSRSYGPGRYDTNYEEKGIDYPIGYVRWTEKRNMESFLDLVSQGNLNVGDLITHRFKFADAQTTYNGIVSGKVSDYLGIVFEYEEVEPAEKSATRVDIKQKSAQPSPVDKVTIGCIGAGNFAKTMLLPHLASNRHVLLKGVATSTGASAKNTAEKFRFEYATTAADDIINDETVNTIVISTRHNLHADFVIAGLKSGKNVLVEKPLALNEYQLNEIVNAHNESLEEGKPPFLMVGYNRRFAPLSLKLKTFFANRSFPMVAHYRVNAGIIPKSSWYQDPEEGGGRIIGEVCHFVDYLIFLTGALPQKVAASSVNSTNRSIPNWDNVSVNIEFNDGSVGNIIYTAIGDSSFPKEYVEVFCESCVGVLRNFSSLELYKNGKKTVKKFAQGKGHAEEMGAFIESVKKGAESPISFSELIASSRVTFAIHKSLETGAVVEI